MPSLSAKQGGGFAFCLMPVHEEAVLGPGPIFLASVALVLMHGACDAATELGTRERAFAEP